MPSAPTSTLHHSQPYGPPVSHRWLLCFWWSLCLCVWVCEVPESCTSSAAHSHTSRTHPCFCVYTIALMHAEAEIHFLNIKPVCSPVEKPALFTHSCPNTQWGVTTHKQWSWLAGTLQRIISACVLLTTSIFFMQQSFPSPSPSTSCQTPVLYDSTLVSRQLTVVFPLKHIPAVRLWDFLKPVPNLFRSLALLRGGVRRFRGAQEMVFDLTGGSD